MKRLVALGLAGILAFGLTPAFGLTATSGADATAAPVDVLQTDPVGTLRWLPANANDAPPVFGQRFRLVVVYDRSLDEGQPTDLLTKGPFGMKLFTTAVADGQGNTLPFRLVDHSEHVTTLESQGAPAEVSDAFMGFAGDVRDANCEDAGTDAFSAAYTVTREVPADYQLQECETLDETIVDADGVVVGQIITHHVPGFWMEIEWPNCQSALDGSPGRCLAEVWYGALYDTDGTGDGEWYAEVDSPGQSVSVYGPGDYLKTYELFAPTPGGAAAPECHDWIPQNPPTSLEEIEVEIPEVEGAKEIIFKLYPKGDWDLFVNGPGGEGSAGNLIAEETVSVSYAPGTYTVRGCNFAGEALVHGAVIVR